MLAVDVSDNITPPAGSAGSDKWLTIGQLLGVAAHIFPSGDTSGATDRAVINNIVGNLGECRPSAGDFWIDSPLLPAGSATKAAAIIGEFAGWGTDNDFYGTGSGTPTGTVIHAAGGFAGEAAILMDNEASTQWMAPSFRDFVVHCESMPAQAGGVAGNGIELTGPWAAGIWERLLVFKPQGNGIVMQNATGAGSGNPDNMIMRAVKASGARGAGGTGGTGMLLIHCPDLVASDCEASECAGSAWLVGSCTNGMISNCKGENSLRGWRFGGFFSSGSYLVLNGITSNENLQDGMLFDQSVGSSAGTYIITGGKATNDGQSGAGYAGFRATGCPSGIRGSNLLALGASYGAVMESSSHSMQLAGDFSGSIAATHDDGSNAAPLAVLQTSGTWDFAGAARITAPPGSGLTVSGDSPSVLVKSPVAPASVNFTGQSNGSYYSGFNMGDNVYPLDALGHYWGIQHTSGHQFLIFSYNGAGSYVNALALTEAGSMTIAGSLDISTAGAGLKVAEGSNAKQGTLTLNGTTAVVVANTSVTANSRIFLTIQVPGGTVGSAYVSARTAGTSFSVKSTTVGDTSTCAYFITEPG